jgi:RHS repeat-associated protein
MVAKTDRNGQTFYWEYDGPATGSRCIHTWGDGGLLEGWIEYKKGHNIVTNSLGQKTIYYYNDQKLCTQITDPLGNHVFHQYTEFGEPYRDIDEEGEITGYTYDDRGNVKTIVQPDGGTSTFLYDEENRLILAVSPGGNSVVRTYRKDGLLISTEGPDGSVTGFEYTEKGLVESIRDNKGQYTKLEYDEDHNLIKAILPDESEVKWRYTAMGLCDQIVNAEKHKKNIQYDNLGRPVKIYDFDWNPIKLHYNAYDEVILAEDKHHSVKFEYTPMGSLKMREENGAKVNFKYNTEEQLQAIINEHGEAYRFARNGKGDIIQEVGFDGLTRKFIRDRSGKVIKVERPGNRFTIYEYDAKGKISRAEHSDGTWETYGYNRDGLLTEAINQHTRVIFHRDKAGRIVKEEQEGYTVESTYDKLGYRTGIKSSLGADLNFERNTSGFVTHLKASDQGTTWNAHMTYNSLGQELERVMEVNGVRNLRNEYIYDDSGRVRTQKINSGNRVKRHKDYRWDMNYRLTEVKDMLAGTTTFFDHDKFGNLIRSITGRKEDNYFRDEVGNIFKDKDKKDRKYGAGGKLLQNKDTHYQYDEEGNLTEKSGLEGTWRYQWNGNGMLKEVTRPDNKKVSFEYDALGRRTAKIFNGNITRWVWSGNTPLHEWKYNTADRPKQIVDEVGMLAKDREEPIENLITWVFDEGTFRPSCKIENGISYSIISDYLGTPVEAYDKYADQVWSCELETYGKVKSFTGEEGFIPFRFQGQYHDVETGLYYNRFRYYAPEEGMYVSQDPIGLAGGRKLFSYVSDPYQYVDLFGWEDIWFRALRQQDMDSLDSGSDIIPKNPLANNTPLQHVLEGSTEGYGDQYISLTKDRGLAESWARKSGKEVAEIDLDKVANTKLNLTTPEGRIAHLGDASRAPKGSPIWDANKKAKGAKELLVEGSISGDAVINRYKPTCK